MRIEYTLNNFVPDFFDALDDFLGNFPSIYILKDSNSDRRVYRNVQENLDLVFFSMYVDNVSLCVTPLYDSTKEIWKQKDILCTDYGRFRNPDTGFWEYSYIFPMPCLKYSRVGSSPKLSLVANYNSENNTFMFSLICSRNLNYGFTTASYKVTGNLMFGGITKYLDFSGGFFCASTDASYYWKKWIKDITKLDEGVFSESLVSTFFSLASIEENTFFCVMRADVDNKPIRFNNASVIKFWAKRRQWTEEEVPIQGAFVEELFITSIWASTEINSMYADLVCSITDGTIAVPRYEPLLSHEALERGHTNNTLNNISMIMPLWFMVQRDPEVLNNFSAIGKNDVINFVNMYNMGTNKIENGTYPIKECIYDCFNIGARRSLKGIKGYGGIAFKQEE